MILFGLAGFVMIVAIALTVRPWLTEARRGADARTGVRGAGALVNRNTILLTAVSVLGGLVIYGFTGMYPTFLREALHYSPKQAGVVASFYGAGALLSIAGGWLGDRFSPRIVLSAAFFAIAGLGYLCFHGSGSIVPQVLLTFAYGAIGSVTTYVNLSGYHVNTSRVNFASRASGMYM